MTSTSSWLGALVTMATLFAYEAFLAWRRRRTPDRLARTAHAALREEWFDAVSEQEGSEILAVQTLRNSLMSATMMASTAALALMGTATLAAPSLHSAFGEAPGSLAFTAPLALELVLMALLFASLLSSIMAVRYYNHAGFIAAMPVGSGARRYWSNAGRAYVRRAGVLYSWGLRHLVLVPPILTCLVHPAAGPLAALGVVAVLLAVDRRGNIALPPERPASYGN